MENEKNLFQIELEDIAKSHLKETARWARFLAITGIVGIGLLVVFGIGSAVYNASSSTTTNDDGDTYAAIAGGIVGSLVVAALYFFPCLFLLRFSNKMDRALLSDDASLLSESLRNLKITFRYMGVLTIIMLGFFALGMIGALTSN
ncbi:MAG: hypothetical protein NTW29_16685 [Bacteroidetes bacterium]|nr:hypothetical protein [Bacteroidota bacterium]